MVMRERKIEGTESLNARLFWAEVGPLSVAEQQSVRQICSDAEWRRAQRFKHEPSRHCFLITRRLVRHTLSDLGSRAPEQWRFERGSHGRPHLVNPTDELRGVDFNIAHTDRAVALAITYQGAVGVDLERNNRQVDHDLVARQFFHPTEQRALAELNEEARRRRFLSLWVIKEAWMKADGRGIGAGLQKVVVAFDDAGAPILQRLPQGDPSRWSIALCSVDDHLLAVAHRDLNF